jgi:hypothetical protein
MFDQVMGHRAGHFLHRPMILSRGLTCCAVLASALALAGCDTTGQSAPGVAANGQPTVAFESIDGPPDPVFRRLVSTLNDEARARQLAVVSRTASAQYRLRGYLATHVQGGKTAVTWVWDVYDAHEQRTQRLSGEESLGKANPKAWSEMDDDAIRRVAQDGMTQLTAYLAGGSRSSGAPVAATPDATPPAGEQGPAEPAPADATIPGNVADAQPAQAATTLAYASAEPAAR